MRRLFLLPVFICSITFSVASFEGKKSQWQGYAKTDFKIDGRACFVVEPKTAAEGKPWVWRARFPGYHSEIDQLLLADGYHIAHMDTGGMLGSPAALKHWEAFYKSMTAEHQLNKKAVLYGVSRGGLFVYRWAKNHPETVACIYNDVPVCDFKSWPGGRGKGKGDAKTWGSLLVQYGFNEAEALAYKDNPIDNLEPVAKAQIPIMHIVTENDLIVPPSENTYVVKKNLEALGHSVFYVVSLAKGPRLNGHHFDLSHPEIGANFIKKYSEFGEEHPIYLRSGLENSRHIFETTKEGRVAFLGGSITQMAGWRNHVADSLKKRFPDTKFDFVFAGIGSTDSTMGVFRLRQDIFGRGQVDMLFIESAVNELHNGRTKAEIQRATEGIVLNARQQNPNIDIIAQYFYDPNYVTQVRAGKTPGQIAALDRVAVQHGVNAIDQTVRCTTLFDSGKMTTKEFGGVHPRPPGHKVYAEMIDALFDKAWAAATSKAMVPHGSSWRFDPLSFSHGHFQGIETAKVIKGWQIVKKWRPKSGSARGLDVGVTYMEALEPGGELTVEFSGTAIGLRMVAGPDVGIIEFSIDGGEPKTLDQFTRWSKGLHIPWIYMLETALSEGKHTLTLRTTDTKNTKSTGNACRFRHFAVNGPD
jgi:pimeloyl-ACP methyl ester carboxylesterase